MANIPIKTLSKLFYLILILLFVKETNSKISYHNLKEFFRFTYDLNNDQ